MNAIDLMMLEHQAIKTGLMCIESLARRASRTGTVERDLVTQVLAFLRGFADKIHHGKEEHAFFPWLVGRGLGGDGDLVADLTREHERLRALVSEMESAIAAQDDGATPHFVEAANAYVSLLRSHVRREDDHLFGAASLLASPAEHEQLQRDFAAIDGPHQALRHKLLQGLQAACTALELPPFTWQEPTSRICVSSTATELRRHHVAIVGAGPAGFYTAAALLNQSGVHVEVDLIDRLPTPYGLVRAGIAPDHANAKGIVKLFERWVSRPGFSFFGNVELGRDVTVDELLSLYDQVVYATGSEADRRLGIPGEGLPGTTPASVFVGWYNAHPDYRDACVDLGCRRVAIVGNGNVALDIARILARDVSELSTTEIADHALSALQDSSIEDIYVLGRRGITEAAFGPKELVELCNLKNVDIVVSKEDLAASALEQGTPAGQRNLELLRTIAERPHQNGRRRVHLRFFVTPTAAEPHDQSRCLRHVDLALTRPDLCQNSAPSASVAGPTERLQVEWLYSAIGYRGRPIAGVPFDEAKGVVANIDGRVVPTTGNTTNSRQYCVGWARTGARGVIGTHKLGAERVVELMLSDATNTTTAAERQGRRGLHRLLDSRHLPFISFGDWQTLDAIEVARGRSRGAPRSKLATIPDLLQAANAGSAGATAGATAGASGPYAPVGRYPSPSGR